MSDADRPDAGVQPPMVLDPDAQSTSGPPTRRRRVGVIITIVVLAIALAASVAGGAYTFMALEKANERIDELDEKIDEQQREIDEQKELIDQKQEFGAAMSSLMDTAAAFQGVPLASLVPYDQYQNLVDGAWAHRWESGRLAALTDSVEKAQSELQAVLEDAATQRSSNVSGYAGENAIDELGDGFVTSVIDDAVARCGSDALACVSSGDPLLVHFDQAGDALPYMTDWIRTGIAYHEFAHVLQFANPAPTETALAAFDGDYETMADCFALTYLDGWSLDHRVWTSSYEYWDVNIGYGYTCDESQRQTIRDWRESMGIQNRTLSPAA